MAARIKSAAALGRLSSARKPREAPGAKEKDVARAVAAYLAAAGIFCWRTNSGTQFVAGRKIQLAPAGTADLIGCLPGGRFLGVELKRPVGGRLSPAQKAWIDAVNRLGGLAFVASSVGAVYEALSREGYGVPRPA